MDHHRHAAPVRPEDWKQEDSTPNNSAGMNATRVEAASVLVAATAVLVGFVLLLMPDDAMAATVQGVINRLGNLFGNAVPRLADYSYFASPFLFVGAMLVGLCKRHWSMLGGTLAMGVAYVVNMQNSEALPVLTPDSASLYHTSNGVFLMIGGVLLMIFFRLLFSSKG